MSIFLNLRTVFWLSVQFSRSVVSNSLWPHEPQHARPPCPDFGYIWGYWYFSWQSWFQLVLHLAWYFAEIKFPTSVVSSKKQESSRKTSTGLEEAQAGIKIARRNINNLRYADDPILMAESGEELKRLLMKEESKKVGLKLNVQKTKIMVSSPITSW